MKKILVLVKKIIFSFLLIYGFNMLYGTFKINVPLNYYTIGIVTLLGLPGLCAIILVSILLF